MIVVYVMFDIYICIVYVLNGGFKINWMHGYGE